MKHFICMFLFALSIVTVKHSFIKTQVPKKRIEINTDLTPEQIINNIKNDKFTFTKNIDPLSVKPVKSLNFDKTLRKLKRKLALST